MIDALAISKKLKESGFTPQQAEAQAELWSDLVESELATKRDLKDLDIKLSQVEANLKRDIKELDLKISQVEANLRRDIKELELKNEKGHSDARTAMWQVGLGLAAFTIGGFGLLIRLFAHP